MASIYDTPADLNLIQTYVPLPFEEMARGLEARQARYDETASLIPQGGSFLDSINAAGVADQEYMAELQEGYAREVVDQFQYGQVDFTDPNVTSRLSSKIREYINRPEFANIAKNAELYPKLLEAYKKAAIEQPNTPYNYRFLEDQIIAFDESGSRGNVTLSEPHVPEPADIHGDVSKIANDLRARGTSGSNDLDVFKRTGSWEGVDRRRLYSIFGIGLSKDGSSIESIRPERMLLNTATGQELNRKTLDDIRFSEELTLDDYEDVFNENYVGAIESYLNNYSWDKSSDSISRGLSWEDREIAVTGDSLQSTPGNRELFEQLSKMDSGQINLRIVQGFADKLTGDGQFESLDQIIGDLIKDGNLDSARDEFVKMSLDAMALGILSPDDISNYAKAGLARANITQALSNRNFVFSQSIDDYAESLFNFTVATMDPTLSEAVLSEQDRFVIANLSNRIDGWEDFGVRDKVNHLNRAMAEWVTESKMVTRKAPSDDADIETYNKRLAMKVLQISDTQYEAKVNKDAPGWVGSKSAKDKHGMEVTPKDFVRAGSIIRPVGELNPSNSFGPGTFAISIDGDNFYFEGTDEDVQNDMHAWKLFGYNRSISGIASKDDHIRIPGTDYTIYTVKNPMEDNRLEIRYKKEGSDWEVYTKNDPNVDIFSLYYNFMEDQVNVEN